MRLTIFALFLSAGTAAFGQSAPPAHVNPNPQGLTPPQCAQPGRDFSAQPREWHFNTDLSQKTIILPTHVPQHQKADTLIDPNIVVHPPQSSLGEQSPGAQIAQNLYPGLALLPINDWKGNAKQIPSKWPNLKVQNIPTAWPKLEIKPVETGAAKPAGK